MEDIDTGGDMSCKNLAQKFSEEKNVTMLPRDHSCDILMKNVVAFASVEKPA